MPIQIKDAQVSGIWVTLYVYALIFVIIISIGKDN